MSKRVQEFKIWQDMMMTPRLRKFALTAHITISVGWLGAIIAYLPLAITGLRSQDAQLVHAVYLAMKLIGLYALIPLSFAALSTGLVQALFTQWGLFRHYWVLAKFGLTSVATIILLIHMRTVSRMAGIAADAALSNPDLGPMRMQLVVHAAGGLIVLIAITILSVYKPWGRTAYGQRKQNGTKN